MNACGLSLTNRKLASDLLLEYKDYASLLLPVTRSLLYGPIIHHARRLTISQVCKFISIEWCHLFHLCHPLFASNSVFSRDTKPKIFLVFWFLDWVKPKCAFIYHNHNHIWTLSPRLEKSELLKGATGFRDKSLSSEAPHGSHIYFF